MEIFVIYRQLQPVKLGKAEESCYASQSSWSVIYGNKNTLDPSLNCVNNQSDKKKNNNDKTKKYF